MRLSLSDAYDKTKRHKFVPESSAEMEKTWQYFKELLEAE